DVKPCKLARGRDRRIARGRGDHQARAAEHALAMGADYPGVGLGRRAEVVGGENHRFLRRARRARRAHRRAARRPQRTAWILTASLTGAILLATPAPLKPASA